MSAMREGGSQGGPPISDLLESIARSLNLLVKLRVVEAQGERKQNEMILWLHSLGFRPIEIAEVLGKTANDINPVISRARKGGRGHKKAVRKGE